MPLAIYFVLAISVYILLKIIGARYRQPTLPRLNGIEVILDPADADLDIITVHGLGSDPERTWTRLTSSVSGKDNEQTRVNWLRDEEFLRRDFPRARVLNFGYNSDWLIHAPAVRPKERAAALLRTLKEHRKGIRRDRPLIFIGHSFGGIIIKYAFCHTSMHGRGEYEDLFLATAGFIFLGTPHQGAKVSFYGLVAALAAAPFVGSNPFALRLLQQNSADLRSLREDFAAAVRQAKSLSGSVYTMHETFQSMLFGWIPLGLIVDGDSAMTELGPASIPLDKSHTELNKCVSKHDQMYRELVGIISSIVLRLADTARSSQTLAGKQTGQHRQARSRFASMQVNGATHNGNNQAGSRVSYGNHTAHGNMIFN